MGHNMAIAMLETMFSPHNTFAPSDLFGPLHLGPSLDLLAAHWPVSAQESHFYQSSTSRGADGLKRKLVSEEHEDSDGNTKRLRKRQMGKRWIIERDSGDGEVKRQLKNLEPDEVEEFEEQWHTSDIASSPKKMVRFAKEKDTLLYDALDAEVMAAKAAADKAVVAEMAAKEAAEAREIAKKVVAACKKAEEAAAAKEAAARKKAEVAAAAKEAAARKKAEEAAAAKEAALIDKLGQYGFDDTNACKEALKQTQGDVKAAIKVMVGALRCSK